MLLFALQNTEPHLTWGSLIDIPLDFATLMVLLLVIGGPLLIWWANKPSTMERYGTKRVEPEDGAVNTSGLVEEAATPTPRRQESHTRAAPEGRTPGSARKVRKEKSAPRV